MSQVPETVLSTLTDNLVENFFEGTPSAANIITPTENQEPEADKTTAAAPKETPAKPFTNPVNDFDTTELIGDLLKTEELDEPAPAEEKRGPGRPAKKENEQVDFSVFLEDGVLSPFEDDAPIKSVADLKELIKANRADDREKAKTEAVKSYKEALPDHVNLILEYVENGGQEFDNFLKALGQVQQVADLSLDNAADRKEIIRKYYTLQDWAPDEIDEHIESLLDMGEEKLAAAAGKLKPKLDKMQEEAVSHQMENQKKVKAQQEAAQRTYVSNVVNALKKGTLGDIKITKEEQRDIYAALVEEKYQSVDGGITNRLGVLLDKIQFVEPDYDLLSKVTLYISDPKGFEKKIREQIKQEVTAETVKKIKSEQGLSKTGTPIENNQSGSRIKRLDSNFKNPFL